MSALSDSGLLRAPSARSTLDIEGLVREHFSFVWRTLRRLGLPEGDADDAAQQVFIVAASKLEQIEGGSERSYLFGVALRVASKARRTRGRRREVDSDALEERRDSTPGPDELVDRRRARALLDSILETMPEDLRAVFVSYEIEQLTMAEIAVALDLPPGTVASRLRRAREYFTARVKNHERDARFFGERS